jgi:hypothetical protein
MIILPNGACSIFHRNLRFLAVFRFWERCSFLYIADHDIVRTLLITG